MPQSPPDFCILTTTTPRATTTASQRQRTIAGGLNRSYDGHHTHCASNSQI
jgi:hypothetical protein